MDTIIEKVEEMFGMNQEVVPVQPEVVEAPIEAETAHETVVESVAEEVVPEVASEAPVANAAPEAVELGWQKGVHYF